MSLIKKIKNSFFHNHGKNNHVFLIDSNGKRYEIHRFKNSKIKFQGDNNTIEIHAPFGELYLDITIYNNTTIIFNKSMYSRKISISGFDNNGNTIVFGQDFSTTDILHISLLRGDGNIYIGNDCMFAYNVTIQMGDGHAIYDKGTNEIINNNKNIYVGNHVWACADTTFLKGAFVPDNSIVGTKSLITKKFNTPNIAIAGIPAKIVKNNINWTRKSQY